MTRRLRAQWSSFRRIHLAALAADWRRTLLSVVGVAIGVTVVLGVLILKSELVRPFDSFGPSLVNAAGDGVIAVTPNVQGRLPFDVVDRLRTEVTGAEAVIPVAASLTPVDTTTGSHGFFLLGGSCQIEVLLGPFDCERRSHTDPPAAGPGVPLQIPAVIAERQSLHPGDEVRIPGLTPGSAHIGWTFPEFERVEDINDGYVLLAPSADVAARLLGTPGYATAAFVVPAAVPGADASRLAADVRDIVGGVATAGPPRPQLPAVFENSKQSLDLIALAGIIVGILIAVNTILLAVEDRRAVMGTIGAIGAGPVGLFGGMLGEGAVVGVLGGLLGAPSGFLLGAYLVDRFGQAMLAGSGATITAHFTPGLVGVAAAAGALCGILAMSGPAVRLIRAGPLAAMANVGGMQRERRIPLWPLLTGIGLLVGAAAVSTVFAHGPWPVHVGVDAMAVALWGVVLTTVWVAPRAVSPLITLVTTARPALGRLLGADFRRYALLFALSAALLAEATSLAIGSQSMQLLGTEQIAAQKATRLPAALLISPQSVLDQRDGRLAEGTYQAITAAAGDRSVSSRWRSTMSSGAQSRLIDGVTPGDWYSTALYEADTPDSFWPALAHGAVGLSEIAANRLGVHPGGRVALPTAAGPKTFDVAGIFRPRMVNDAAVGDVVLVSASLARADWAALRDQVAVAYASPAEATDHRADFTGLGAGLRVYDNEQWRAEATPGITRFLQPFTIAGYVVMAAAGVSVLNVFVLGLLQRTRERAVLRAVGTTSTQEQLVIVANAVLLASLVAVLAVLGGIGLTYLWSLGSPVYYGIAIDWGVPVLPLRTGVAAVFGLVLAAAVYPMVRSCRLETAAVLRNS